ncbi:hypothetical protein GGF38_004757, partial [Coemansia sp. RSA 25]
SSAATSPSGGKPEEVPAPDTQLPSFLFPRRRTAARNREIASLPHYSEVQQPIAASPHSPDSAALTGLAISRKEDDDLANESQSESPQMEATISPRSSASPEPDAASANLSEVQQLLQDERVSVVAESVAVSRCQFIPAADMPATADGKALASGSRVIQRAVLGYRAIYISPSDLIEVASAEDDGMAEHDDNRRTSARVPLTSLVRASRLGTDDASPIRAESKCGRFDSATWIEYSPNDDDSGFANLVNAIQAAVSENAGRGLPEHLYKQAECLRCNWHGYVDHERTAFDAISDSEFTVIPPPAKELQCPKCKRSYLREYYAADEQRDTADESISAAQTASAPIWKQPFVTRRNRPNPTAAGQTAKSAAAKASERRARHAQHLEAARGALAADAQKLDSIAAHGELPFAK